MSTHPNTPDQQQSTGSENEHEHTFIKKHLAEPEPAEKKPKTKRAKTSAKKKIRDKKSSEDDASNREHKETKRAMERRIEDDLNAIYQDSDGNIPDMKTFVRRRRSRLLGAFLVLCAACVFLAAVAWYGFVVLQPDSTFSEDDVILTVSGDTEVAVGEEVTYRIRYKNAQAIDLHDVKLEIRYPKQFVFVTSSEPVVNELNDTWNLAMIEATESGYIDVTGRLYGDLGTEHSFRVFLNYTPENFSSPFQKVAGEQVVLSDSPLTLTLDGPDEALAGSAVTYMVGVSTPEFALDDTFDYYLVLSTPQTFSLKDSSLKPDVRPDRIAWPLTEALFNEPLKIEGVFLPDEDTASTTFGFAVIGMSSTTEPFVFTGVNKTVTLSQTDLSATLAVNGSMGELSATPGEFLTASVVIENTGETKLGNVEARLVYDAPSSRRSSLLDWAELDDVFDGNVVGKQESDTRRLGMITWDKSEIGDLGELAPGERVLIDVRLPIKDADDADLSAFTESLITAAVELRYDRAGDVKLSESNQVRITVNSDTALEVRDQTDDADTHVLTWLLTNTFHPLKNITLSADLFGEIEFDPAAASVPAGEIEYNKDTQELVWRIDAMPLAVDTLALQFSVTLLKDNPSQTNLTSRVRLEATDTVTGQELLVVGDEVKL